MINISNTPKAAKIISINPNIQPKNKTGRKTEYKYLNKIYDIKARGAYPSNILSNFAPTSFKIDGVKVKSLEGLLQSLKVNNPETQRKMCLLDGFKAKKMSKSIKHPENDMLLFWKGKTFLKGSEKYKELKQAVIEASKKAEGEFFNFEGEMISSVNAFLMAIKVNNHEIQNLILKMPQENLKTISKNITPKYQIRDLYWNGKIIKRDSKEYQELLDKAYKQRFKSDFLFRKALKDSKGYTLIHTRGKTDISDTVLTQSEFLQRLNKLRNNNELKYKLLDAIYSPYYKFKECIKLLMNKIPEYIGQ